MIFIDFLCNRLYIYSIIEHETQIDLMWQIIAKKLERTFNQKTPVFEGISFEIENGESLVITGPNGSGKTTLLRIISRILPPTSGQIDYYWDGQHRSPQQLYPALGFVGPYLQLYNNLTALENYSFFARIRGFPVDVSHFKSLMEKVGLAGRELDELRAYSSGMMQRMKYVCALLHQPEILILDEPTSNLDQPGAEIVYQIMNEQRQNKILIVATNNPGEIAFGDKEIQLAA